MGNPRDAKARKQIAEKIAANHDETMLFLQGIKASKLQLKPM
jgi:hypothetical protein